MTEIWNAEKAKISYVAFDLESDGDDIREFAFRAEGTTRKYDGEEQIGNLGRALRDHSIIVGHNIKKWDLPILEKKGIHTDAFVWDTLEIEMLLDPCRYAYSLHTVHHASEDVGLTDSLFWDQLYRLSQDSALCERFSNFFPADILSILQELHKPWLMEFFKKEARDVSDFFQAPGELDPAIVSALKGIDDIVGEGTGLIVAPREIWGYIAQYVTVSFPAESEKIAFRPFDTGKIASYTFDSPLDRAILERYIEGVKTPVPANLAQYLRINIFPSGVISSLVTHSERNVRCVDADGLPDIKATDSFNHVFLIGAELVNRLHQYRLDKEYEASDFIDEKCWIPMRLASAGFVSATEDDCRRMASFVDKDVFSRAKNVWVERRAGEKLVIGYSLDFQSSIEALLERVSDDAVHTIPWNRVPSVTAESFRLVTSECDDIAYDPRENRVTSVSSAKAAYWAYQFKLLDAVKADSGNRPIVYVVDDAAEIKDVREYAVRKGYQVPPELGLSAAQTWMHRRRNALMVVCRDEVPHFLALRSTVSYSVVFDRISVEKCMMMWRGMTFGDEAKLAGASEIGTSGVHHGGTPRDAMLSAWPVFVHYHRLVIANNRQSVVYLLDPYLDDYPELAESWKAGSLPAPLWKEDAAYLADIACATEVFPVVHSDGSNLSSNKVAIAMNVIKDMLLPEGADWHNYQKPVLREILSKKHDLIVSIPTGGGKSVLFQGPALYQAMRTNRLSIVITPLKALMEDQIIGLRGHGFSPNVEYLNSDRSYFETRQIYRRIGGGEISLLYVTPERFRSKTFINALDRRIAMDDGLEYFIFDEAHCVSQWGQEFRPDYLHVIDWCRNLKLAHPSTCATFYSATMTGLIENDIRSYMEIKQHKEIFGKNKYKDVVRVGQAVEDYNPIREHIGMSFQEVGVSDSDHCLAITEYINGKKVDADKSRMLVFCLLRRQCEETADALRPFINRHTKRADDDVTSVDFFHAGMDSDEREDALKRFRDGNTPFLCATKAFGMGMDIPNVHYVVHYSPPRVLEDYLQEVGRAGRNKRMYEEIGFGPKNPLPALCLYSKEDFRRHADMLKLSELIWSDLIELHSKILSFARELQCLETMQNTPVVIPVNFWKKGVNDDVTSLRLALHWLEKLHRIRLGFTRPACICVELTDKEFKEWKIGRLQTLRIRRAQAVYDRIRQISAQRGNKRIQVQVSELLVKGKVSARQAMDALVDCVKAEGVVIQQVVQCGISQYRDSETRYVNKDPAHRNHVVLRWVFEFALSMLRLKKNAKEEIILDGGIEKILLNDIQDGAMSELDSLLIIINQNGTQIKKLPWFNPEDRMDNRGFVNPETYLADFYKKRASRVYDLVSLIPGISVRTFFRDKRYVHVIRNVGQDACRWLSDFESDCWKLLLEIGKWPSRNIRWQDLMEKCDLIDKGFEYFSSLMNFLSSMSYIETESLLPFGIEAYGTARTEDEIPPHPENGQDDYPVWTSFDEVSMMRAVRLAAMAAFSRLHKEEYGTFIQRYFQCASKDDYLAFVKKYAADNDEIMSLLTDKALEEEERKLTDEQKEIYNAPLHCNINVLAGPGAGKTHVLALRCARLIYKEGVSPDNILVLAFNRAVVVELKNRLERLFRGLGLSRRASSLHVHTFHSLAKKVCGNAVKENDMDNWEETLVEEMRKNPQSVFKRLSPSIQYVLIDEFQDITFERMDVMDLLRERYAADDISFFTIGDKYQSIYGFERKKHGHPMSPEPYYRRLNRDYAPMQLSLYLNFRSYQGILDAAATFIPKIGKQFIPESAPVINKNAPAEPCVEIFDNRRDFQNIWYKQFVSILEEARKSGFADIAIFFRTNAEVFQGYSRLRDIDLGGARLRIQGTSGELWRTREVFAVIWYLKQNGNNPVIFKEEQTRNDVRNAVETMMREHSAWDRFYLDLAFTLTLNVLDGLESEVGDFHYSDLADGVKDIAQRDDGQCYKIYARYKEGRINQDNQLNIILTTMHKVKGLEFDSVVITPSFSPLPLNNEDPDAAPLTPADIDDLEDNEEERRLLYVAYTRAKKKLRVYKWNREFAIDSETRIPGADTRMGYRDKDELDKLFLSYLARSGTFAGNQYVADNLRRNEPLVLIARPNAAGNLRYVAKHNQTAVASLSGGSNIVRKVEADYFQQPKPDLTGVFVSDIFAWTYEDTVRYDQEHQNDKNPPNFAAMWCDAAKQRGFVYVVDFAGYAKAPHPPADPFTTGSVIPIRGMNFRGNEDAIRGLAPGSEIHFVRDTQSRFGSDSVDAVDGAGRKVGFVSTNVKTVLSRYLQSGKQVIARFNGKISNENWGSTALTVIRTINKE